ncbi:MAG: hypothetical protein PUG15_02285 [Bacteroidales bacterium]|nr:hypothetical protein [Bacteroidales bacterium]
MKNIIKISLSLFLFLSLFSCERLKHYNTSSDDLALVEVNGEKLYLSDIEAILPENISSEDSAAYADDYIKKWATRILLYQKAANNIDSKQEEEVARLVEDYRRSLIVHLYQRNLIAQKVKAPTEAELLDYYKANSEDFRLQEEIFKGLYMGVPKNAPKLSELRRDLGNIQKKLQEIEKFSYQNAVGYEYFMENWMKRSDFPNIPQDFQPRKGLQEFSDEQNVYFLYVTEMKQKGETMPFDFAKQEIVPILREQKSFDFIRRFDDELYERAVRKEEIVRNIK